MRRGPVDFRPVGVVTGPKTFVRSLVALVLRRWSTIDSYVVDAATAVELLHGHDPGAALWWRTHAPHMLRPGRRFVFHAQVCELLPGSGEFATADTSVDQDGPFVKDVQERPTR